jgi:ATP-dependent DNA helicase UvrD/PcrA
MADLLDQLNPQQREAVEHLEGPVLVLAGAGSGKTRVITYRIAHLISARGVPPESILAVTFTNKAADQMKERVAALLSENLETYPHISTFHSFCVRVLRQDIARLAPAESGEKYSYGFSIYDEDDQLRIVHAAMGELGLAEQMISPRAALSQISYAKNRGRTPADIYQHGKDEWAERLAQVYDRYEKKLREANALDFDDLLLRAVELFYQESDVTARYNRRFHHVLVDEYQDTNRAQYQLIRQLTLEHQNLCVVGDEDQSIYRWRGADIENILSFERDYPAARVIRLEQNYRSTQGILDAATAVVSRNTSRMGKTLRTDRGAGSRVALYEAADPEDEAAFVAASTARNAGSSEAGTVGVLFRTNAQSRRFEEALSAYAVTYRIVGSFSFYERAEIRDTMAYARLSTNPRDTAALLRVINTPPRGIGDATVKLLQETAKLNAASLWEALEQELEAKRLPARALKALEAFHAIGQALQADREELPVSRFFKSILDRSGLVAALRAEGTPEAEGRLENLEELVNAAAEAEERGETLAEFLDRAALVADTDAYDDRARVTLMTLHSAKGLEFTTVYLVGMEEGLFPHKLSLTEAAELEEERRLCYVGMTRARDRLILSWSRTRRSFAREAREDAKPSRFLSEVPAELIEPLNQSWSGSKPRTEWENALNSAESAERFLRQRGFPIGRPKRVSGLNFDPPASKRSSWKLGSLVRHPKYGLGTVIECEGEGGDTKLTISFPDYGIKKLVERYASLEKA